jgi:UPF0755 protein
VSPRKPRSGSKVPKKGRPLFAFGLLLLLFLIPAAMAAIGWWQIQQPYKGYPEDERRVEVAAGSGATATLERLEQEGVLANSGLARVYLIAVLGNPPIQAGEYVFRGPLTTAAVLRKLIRGEVATDAVTLVEGLTLEETAAQLAAAGFGDQQVFLDLLRSPDLISDLDPQASDLEGYLFPETYRFARSTPEPEIVRTLVRTFRSRFEQVRPLLDQRPRAGGVRELVTLASIIEKEAQLAAERPLIAAVYQNRIERGIGLQADPTVIFALKRQGRWNGNLRRDDLRMDSPYNTYRYAGLPPGPICSPGLASLRAAADPADAPYIYFVSRNDGSHVFAETLAEHNRNVERWQRRYWRERRAAEREAGR